MRKLNNSMRKLYSLKNFIVGACLMIAPMFVGCSDDDDEDRKSVV